MDGPSKREKLLQYNNSEASFIPSILEKIFFWSQEVLLFKKFYYLKIVSNFNK